MTSIEIPISASTKTYIKITYEAKAIAFGFALFWMETNTATNTVDCINCNLAV